ncbi:GDSL-type esterase/lipase family protein [Draconibacterium mangrovi]|uniref:GDSL-type esterase/lipase family protein n=1 Tax=Draconibacterium mangrovi TaxID=2697469 RepID=UPI0013D71C65|nr:GDSL-type esterase/lipase family protein [Draconibacterium mangrovi]
MKRNVSNIYKYLAYVLIHLLLINPLTLFLLTKSVLITLLISLVLLGVTLYIILHDGNIRVKVYYYNILFLVSIFYNAELIFRVNFTDYNIPNLYEIRGKYYFNKGNLTKVLDDGEYVTDYVTNKQGYRIAISLDPSIEVKKCDWLFLGDSFTQGAQVNYEKLYTTQLYQYFPDKVILNAGISGYSLIDAYNYYVNEGCKLNPDKVFLQLGTFNDFMNVTSSNIGISEYLMQYSELYRYVIYNTMYQTPNSLPLGRFTEPFYPNEKDNIDYNIFYKESSSVKENDIANLRSYLKKFNDAVKRNGSELIVVLLPTKEQTNYQFFEQVIENFNIEISKLDMQFPNKKMVEFSKEIGFQVIDVLDSFLITTENLFYEQDEHLNEWGHEVVAKTIASQLEDNRLSYLYLSKTNNGNRYPNYYSGDSLIIYQGIKENHFQIFMNNRSFDAEMILLSSNEDKIHPRMSARENYIAYTIGDQESNRTKVILEDFKGEEVKVLPTDQNQYAAIPSFSNDEQFLVYPSWEYNNGLFTNPIITLYNILSGESFYLTQDIEETWRPVFHPNDSVVYYIGKGEDKNFSIKCINIYTQIDSTVLTTDYNIWDPCISSDGSEIVFAGYENDNWDLFIYNINSKSIERLTETIGNEWDPSFNRKADEILFAGSFGLNNGIYTMKLEY